MTSNWARVIDFLTTFALTTTCILHLIASWCSSWSGSEKQFSLPALMVDKDPFNAESKHRFSHHIVTYFSKFTQQAFIPEVLQMNLTMNGTSKTLDYFPIGTQTPWKMYEIPWFLLNKLFLLLFLERVVVISTSEKLMILTQSTMMISTPGMPTMQVIMKLSHYSTGVWVELWERVQSNHEAHDDEVVFYYR